MSSGPLHGSVLVIGAGTMGAGIAQVALQAGWRVALWDQMDGSAAKAAERIHKGLGLAEGKGKLPAGGAEAAFARLALPGHWSEGTAQVDLAIEAIVEDLGIKQDLFEALDAALGPHALLASNTSALALASIAQAAKRHPERVLGMHFFNPAPLMALVEIISPPGLSTESLDRAEAIAKSWGKKPIHAADTPGFVVNRVARPYYGEALRLVGDGLASPDAVDAAMKLAGFKMGPCALMDLIGLDINLAVTQAVDAAFFGEARYRPHPLQAQMVGAGRLGRKSQRGFYRYDAAGQRSDALALPTEAANNPVRQVCLVAESGERAQWVKALGAVGIEVVNLNAKGDGLVVLGLAGAGALPQLWAEKGPWPWVLVVEPSRAASQWSAMLGGHPSVAITHQWGLGEAWTGAEWAASLGAAPAAVAAIKGFLEALAGQPLPQVTDGVGLVAPRGIATLVNEACFAAMQGVAHPSAIDEAMRLGANHPQGPFAWSEAVGGAELLALLEALAKEHGPERYRPAPWLRRRVEAGLPLGHGP